MKRIQSKKLIQKPVLKKRITSKISNNYIRKDENLQTNQTNITLSYNINNENNEYENDIEYDSEYNEHNSEYNNEFNNEHEVWQDDILLDEDQESNIYNETLTRPYNSRLDFITTSDSSSDSEEEIRQQTENL